jgi:hypothetical protein
MAGGGAAGEEPVSRVTIFTIWGWRDDEDGPELLDAWDEYAVDQNFDGYRQAVNEAAEKNDIRGHRIREIQLVADWEPIEIAFAPVDVPALNIPSRPAPAQPDPPSTPDPHGTT